MLGLFLHSIGNEFRGPSSGLRSLTFRGLTAAFESGQKTQIAARSRKHRFLINPLLQGNPTSFHPDATPYGWSPEQPPLDV